MKICGKCGAEKSLDDFNRGRGAQGRHVWCRSCQKEHYEQNKDRHLMNVRDSKRRRREWLRSLKRGRPCARCNHTGPPGAMHWHHRDPRQKLFSISAAHYNGFSRARVLAEIAKCDLLCADCHAQHHALVA